MYVQWRVVLQRDAGRTCGRVFETTAAIQRHSGLIAQFDSEQSALFSGHHQTTVPAAFTPAPVPVWKCSRQCLHQWRGTSFLTNPFFVRCLIVVHWILILDEIIYPWGFQAVLCCVAVVLLMLWGSTLSESLRKCISRYLKCICQTTIPKKTSCVFQFRPPNSGN